ncbi:MAG TPA: hypothetical protein VJM15_08440 [Sphingomicrobium sp.]|nr:hypothetical protein [Sphingomicrobium sp.]
MKPLVAMIFGLLSFAAPVWFLAGLVRAPQFRTGTIEDFRAAIVTGVTLYGGVLVGVLIARRRKKGIGATFAAGVAGAMAAITLGLLISAVSQLASTGRIMPEGQTLALLPVVYIVGGIVSVFIAAGASLISYGLGTPER